MNIDDEADPKIRQWSSKRKCGIIYIVHRTQLYIGDEAWKTLQIVARQSGRTVSDLVREAVSERYLGGSADRSAVLESVIGLWKDRDDLPDGVTHVRKLRRGSRLARLAR